MSVLIDKNSPDKDILVYDFDKGIAASPHKGIGNLQNVNIATEEGEVMASFGRAQASMTTTGASGTLTYGGTTARVNLNISNTNNKFKGNWIIVSNSSDTGQLPNGTYYVLNSITSGSFLLATSYDGSALTGFLPGLTATISMFRNMSKPIAYTTETYGDSASTRYRYYILDDQGLVWMYDTVNDVFPSDDQQYWVLPDNSISYFSPNAAPSGIGVLNGILMVFAGAEIFGKPTVKLGSSYTSFPNAILMSLPNSSNPHFVLVGHQGRAYYTDGTYIGSIFPDTSLRTGVANVQSYAKYSAATATCTITQLLAGSIPSAGPNVGQAGFSRIPAVFFAATGGTKPASITVGTVYYIQYATGNHTFEVYDALTGGSAKDMQTGASGVQYYNTFWPLSVAAGAYGSTPLMVFTPQRLNLPIFEIAQCMTEIGNLVIIGGRTAALYPWNQVDVLPSSIIPLPEQDVKQLLTANQMVYVFAGYKANIYITDGNTASLVLKVPDYCAGVPGTPASYIEPRFTWGGVGFVKGRVYFSVLDQTLVSQSITQEKAGNCGGIWSFYPTQNIAFNQDSGPALHLENQNSYGTYNGYATVIIPWFDQNLKAPRYWSGWQSTIVAASATYGIDQTYTGPVGTAIVETDFIPVGTMLNKYTPKQIEYKLAAPLLAGETVTMEWRKNTTDAWTSSGNAIVEGTTALSGYFNANFQGAQWVQLRVTLHPFEGTNTSYTRLSQVRMR